MKQSQNPFERDEIKESWRNIKIKACDAADRLT